MNSLTIVLMLIVGGILVYCAIKGENPVDLTKRALTRGANSKMVGKAGSALGMKKTGAAGSGIK